MYPTIKRNRQTDPAIICNWHSMFQTIRVAWSDKLVTRTGIPFYVIVCTERFSQNSGILCAKIKKKQNLDRFKKSSLDDLLEIHLLEMMEEELMYKNITNIVSLKRRLLSGRCKRKHRCWVHDILRRRQGAYHNLVQELQLDLEIFHSYFRMSSYLGNIQW